MNPLSPNYIKNLTLRSKRKQNKNSDWKKHKQYYDEVPLDSGRTNIEIPDEGSKYKRYNENHYNDEQIVVSKNI